MMSDYYLDKIQTHFKMSFEKVIKEIHWNGERSVKSIARELGISHTPIVRLAKKHKLKLRSMREAGRLALRKKNPIHSKEAAIARANKISKLYREKPLPQEVAFSRILKKSSTKFVFQYPIDKYVIDFFIPDKKLCIEIDTVRKWGQKRVEDSKLKDAFLRTAGYKVVRINKDWVRHLSDILDILEANDIIL